MGYQQINTDTVSSSQGQVILTGIDTDTMYLVTMTNVTIDTDNVYVNARVTASGSEVNDSNYQWAGRLYRVDTSFSNSFGTNQNHMRLNATAVGGSTNESHQGVLQLHSFNSASTNSVIFEEVIYQNGSDKTLATIGGFTYDSNQAHDGIKLYPSSGNFLTGVFTLYKIG